MIDKRKLADVILSGDYPENLQKAVVIDKGQIRDQRIWDFRQARDLFCC